MTRPPATSMSRRAASARFSLLLAIAAALFALGIPAAGVVAGPEASFEGIATAFKQELGSKKHDTRLHAFEVIKNVTDPRAVDLLVTGTKALVAERDKVDADLVAAEGALEKALSKIDKANAAFVNAAPTSVEVEAFNKRAVKLEAERDAATARIKASQVDRGRVRALVDAATRSLGELIERLNGPDIPAALAKLESAWLGEKSSPDDRIRYVDTIARVKTAEAVKRLKALVLEPTQDPRVRVVAIAARVARGDPDAVEDAVAVLADPAWQVQAAAVDALWRLHRPEGIEPLIAYLAREDIGRVREDAHHALRSLTGQTHGPYAAPWKEWWEGAKASFVMPEKPLGIGDITKPEKGVTFYGITTFSDKVLLVLDVSGSMTEPAHPEGAGARASETKIDVARKELNGAIDMLEDKKRFNLVFFSHEVVRYQPGMLAGEKLNRDQAKRFAATLTPSGGTNIHDALEGAFRLAGFGADGKTFMPVVDTIFFLTDGKPTAGKVQEPKLILDEVREWNRSAKITIHAVGMGDCDPVFLQALASENGGRFVQR